MLASEHIKKIQEIIDKEGDLPIYIDTPYGFSSTEELEAEDIDVLWKEEKETGYNSTQKLLLPKRIKIT